MCAVDLLETACVPMPFAELLQYSKSVVHSGIVLQRVASHGRAMLSGMACAMYGICGEVGVGGLGSEAISIEVEVRGRDMLQV